MKQVLTKFLALGSIGLLMLSSCKKNDALVTATSGKAGTLTASTMTPVLDKTKLTDTSAVVNFSFSKANFGFSASITNTLEIDAANDNWAKPTSVTLGNGVYSQSYSTSVFNNLLLKLNLPAGVASQVNVRVVHALSPTVFISSNVLSLTVTPFNLTSWIYATGIFAGWSNPGPLEDSLISATGNGVYTGIINFTNSKGNGDNEFLLLPVKGSWAHKYATNDATGSTSSTLALDASNNFYAPADTGYYIVTADLNKGTIAFQKADYYSLIGTAPPGTAWTTDTPLKFINDGSDTWEINGVQMATGEYKVRQDDAWSNSWGPAAAANTLVSSGAVGDGNIQLTTAGKYNITFIMPPTSGGAKGLATTTYTAVKQ